MLRANFSMEDIVWVLDIVKRELEVGAEANRECVFKDKYTGVLFCAQYTIITRKDALTSLYLNL